MNSTGDISPRLCQLHKVAITSGAQGGEVAGIPVLGNFVLQESALRSVLCKPLSLLVSWVHSSSMEVRILRWMAQGCSEGFTTWAAGQRKPGFLWCHHLWPLWCL